MLKSGSELIRTATLAVARCRLGQDSKLVFVFKIFSFQANHILAGDFIRRFIDIAYPNPRFSGLGIEEIGEI